MMQPILVFFIALAAMARPEDWPKCLPVTTMSPGFTLAGNSGLQVSRTCLRISGQGLKIRSVLTIRSVGMLSPNFQQRPRACMRCSLKMVQVVPAVQRVPTPSFILPRVAGEERGGGLNGLNVLSDLNRLP